MTNAFKFEEIIPSLQAVARSVGADLDEGVSVGWILMERAQRRRRQFSAGWILVGVRRVLVRAAIPAGFVSLDNIDEDRCLFFFEICAASQNVIEQWRCCELDPQTESVMAGLNTAEMAKKQGLTRRAAQMQVDRQVRHFLMGDLFLGVSS
ncbi:MAG: hypothetical protein PHU46_15060 [Rhodocyclaceae bacterium]|nr:hypothetical protein [Rhodocyclaceae bacterium]